jgi:putative transposase
MVATLDSPGLVAFDPTTEVLILLVACLTERLLLGSVGGAFLRNAASPRLLKFWSGSKPVPRHNSVRLCNQQHRKAADHPICYNSATMFDPFRLWFSSVLCVFRSRRSLMLENLALRQQLAVLKREHPRPRLGPLDKLFWVLALRFWSQWKESLILVLPDTVVRSHQAGFKLYWAMLCKVRKRVGGGRRISKQIRELIFQMVAENPSWGAPRIHGELLMLGLDVSERTISRWMKRAPKDPEPAKRWLAFLRNHREAIAAMDFFTVPTITFGVLYCFFVIAHDRRRILHFNVTKRPTSLWIVQQLREAFPFDSAPRFLIFDRDAKYGLEVPAAVRSLKINPVQTSFESPWQNGIAERWVGSCRCDLLDHIIPIDERHLKRLLSEYIRYHHEDRTHLGLGKGTPNGRSRTIASGRVLSHKRLGGLHHRYDRAA